MLTLDLQITNQCNYACEYCYSVSNHKEMSEKTYKRILKIAKLTNINTIEFCGGEPLLHPTFDYFVKLAKDFNLILRTNGIFINKHLSLISAYFSWVGVSLDGLEMENHLMRRSKSNISPKNKFEIPITNIKLLKKRNPNIRILIGSLVSKLNYKHILKLGDYLADNNIPVDIWKLYLFRAKSSRAKLNEKKFILSENEFDKLKFDKIKTLFHKGQKEGGDCLIVTYNGNIFLGNKKISNINEPYKDIIQHISGLTKEISQNKTITYH